MLWHACKHSSARVDLRSQKGLISDCMRRESAKTSSNPTPAAPIGKRYCAFAGPAGRHSLKRGNSSFFEIYFFVPRKYMDEPVGPIRRTRSRASAVVEPLNLNEPEECMGECPICREVKSLHTLRGCNHSFCVVCSLDWFRSGKKSCPLCRKKPNIENLGWATKQGMFKNNLSFAQRKNAPAGLKNLVRRLREIERKQTHLRKVYSEWKKSKKGIEFRRLKRLDQSFKRRTVPWRHASLRSLRGQIAEYPVISILRLVDK